MKNNGRDALELSDLGWHILPLHTWDVDHCSCNNPACWELGEDGEPKGSPAKHPRTAHGLKDASNEQGEILRWWTTWPSANVGVRTGPESGIVVVDIDPRHGGLETWEALEEQHGYDASLGNVVAVTGSGGVHIYYRHPGSHIKSRSGGLGPGVDVKADGGYVVAPPSVHRLGTPYYWAAGHDPWEREIAELPDWLIQLMQEPVSRDKYEAKEHPARFTKGGRNNGLTSLAGVMRNKGFGEAAIFNALMAENETRCEPPLDAREVAQIAKSVMRYEPETAGPLIVDTSRGKTGPERREEAYVPMPRTFRELQAKSLPPLEWAVPRFLPQGCAMLAGAPKLGKSWLMLNLCFAISEGEMAFNFLPTIPGDCLYLALEDGESRLQGRARVLLPESGWPERAWYEVKWPRIDEGGKEALEAWLGQHPGARLVVIDTFVLFKPLDVGKSSKDIYAADYAAVRAVKAIADAYGVCILLVTHLNKSQHEDWVNGMTGSTGLSGSADTLLNLARPEGRRDVEDRDEAVMKLTGRDVQEQDWALHRDGGWWTIEGNASELQERKTAHEVVHFMQMLWEDGHREVTSATLRTVSNKTKQSLNSALARAYRAGMVEKVRYGTYALRPADRPTAQELHKGAKNVTKNDSPLLVIEPSEE